MNVRVKICGLRDEATIGKMDGLPVHEIGFVFAPSRRQVTPELASRLIAAVKRLRGAEGLPPRTVGVFVNPTAAQLQDTLAAAPLDVVQLHGGESAERCRMVKTRFGTDVWKVFPIRGDETESARERLEPYRGAVDAVMIDTAGGGTGQAFDWSVIGPYKTTAGEIGVPLYVAGGLHPGNAAELTGAYGPDGVDVSSGVETDGVKDIEKIKSFVERVSQP